MRLSQALRLESPTSVALVGAGGKTTALLTLAEEVKSALITCSTHLGAWQVAKDRHVIWPIGTPLPEDSLYQRNGYRIITGDREGERFKGLTLEQLEQLNQFTGYHDLPLLMESDGSRQRPLKAPAQHEPVIPDFIETVIVLAGLSGLQKPLNEEFVHHPDFYSELSGQHLGNPISAKAVAAVLTHPAGGLKGIPPSARRIALLNQADTPELQSSASLITHDILGSYDSVVISSNNATAVLRQPRLSALATFERTAGIILAAGGSTRFGKPKPLLDFHGQPFIRTIAQVALESGLDPVIVVIGAHENEVKGALSDLPAMIISNPNWANGQSSSIRVGINALTRNVGAAIFLLADQPQVTKAIIHSLVETHARDLPSVVAPLINGRRGNPVLFDQRTFTDLKGLKGDEGGRAIFSKYSPTYLEWADEALLLDVDTPRDYQKLLDFCHGP
jgi:molybdenum cofactor cytidylyltransferase